MMPIYLIQNKIQNNILTKYLIKKTINNLFK